MKNKEHLHVTHIEVPLYKGFLVIVVSNSHEKLEKIIPCLNEKKEVFAYAASGNYKDHQAFFMVFNFKNSYEKVTHGIVSHEVHHATNFIANSRGILPSFDNDEPTAYLNEWISNQAYKFFKKLKLKPHD